MLPTIRMIWIEDSGQDLIEYGLLLAIITIGVIATILLLQPKVTDAFDSADKRLP